MKKAWILKILIVVVPVIVVAVGAFLLMPNRMDGTTDTPELIEICEMTDEQIENKLIGEYRENIIDSWGEPNGTIAEENADMWVLDEERVLMITYTADGKVKDVGIGIQ